MKKYLLHTAGKNTLLVSLILLLIASATPVVVSTGANTDLVIISLDPLNPIVPAPGQTFTVNVTLANVADCASWEFKLSYNTTLLDAKYVYRPAAWPEPPYTWLPKGADMLWHPDTLPTINDPGGYVWVGCSIPGGSELYGNWTLVTIEFNATEVGSCVLDLYATKLYDSFVTPIVHTALDGSATVVPEFPVAIVMPLLLIATLAVAFLGKMVWSRKRRDAPIAR